MPPLKLTQFNDPAVLNRWADTVEQRLNQVPPANPPVKATSALFQTNSVTNKLQSKLNLKAGSNVTLAADPLGGVLITAAAATGGPNLAFGDPIHYPQMDPASTILVDDFMTGQAPILVGTVPIGQLGWAIQSISGAMNIRPGYPPNNGILTLLTTTNINAGDIITLWDAEFAGGFPLFGVTGWQMDWIFKFPQITTSLHVANTLTKLRFYLGFGFGTAAAMTATRPSRFVGLRYDTDTTSPAISDSTLKFEYVDNVTASNTQGTVIDTGFAPDNNWHRLMIRSIVLNKVLISLDGGTESSFTGAQSSAAITSIARTTNIVTLAAANFPVNEGQLITIAGIVAPNLALNGTFTCLLGGGSNQYYQVNGADIGGTAEAATITADLCLTPVALFINDTQVSPAVKSLLIDWFSLIINPGIATDFSATSNPTKSRYYNLQV
jgi:hypothetical protein